MSGDPFRTYSVTNLFYQEDIQKNNTVMGGKSIRGFF